MSFPTITPLRPVVAGAGTASPASAAAAEPVEFHFTQTESFPALLEQPGVTLLVTTYQANKLLSIRARGGGLSILVRTFERPMGMAVDSKRMALGTRDQVWQFRNAPDLAAKVDPPGVHDACFLPRSSHVTGDVGLHEVCWGGPAGQELWLVSTRFSCLATLDPDYSFVPRWRPPFVTTLAAEDRCHLNGLAMEAGAPRYVTALGRTDTPGGWRAGKAADGCVLSVPDGEVVLGGLCMPHSPRLHAGKLWVLESGTGGLRHVDRATGRSETVIKLPGFARGLAFVGPYAFVGLSKIRASSAMDGVPLAQRRAELKAGIAVVDLRTGALAAIVEFQTAVEEIFDLQVLSGTRFPEVVGFQKDTVQNTFVVPPDGWSN